MSDSQPCEIATERLLLRPFTPRDVDDVLAYCEDADVTRYVPHIPRPYTRRDAEQFVDVRIAGPWKNNPNFAVELGGRVVGSCGGSVRHKTATAELGYVFARDVWGQGYATEAATAAIDWALGEWDLFMVAARTNPGNGASERVLAKLGFRREATLRGRNVTRRGERVDLTHWSVLSEKWEAE